MKKMLSAICCSALLGGCTGTLEPFGLKKDYSAFSNGTLSGCAWPVGMSLQELLTPEVAGNRKSLVFVHQQQQQQQQQQNDSSAAVYQTAGGAMVAMEDQKGLENASRLDWLSCEMLAKSMANTAQADALYNRTEWRDLPLIGAALTTAAVVLFGNRNAMGDLSDGSTDFLQGTALATGGFVLLANYLDPESASRLLYKSANGHLCLAEHGQAVATYGNLTISQAASDRLGELRGGRVKLAAAADVDGVGNADKLRAAAAIARADKAIAFFEKQRTARELAPARLYLSSYRFSQKLMQEARRKPVQIGDLQQQLTASIRAQTDQSSLLPTDTPGTGDGDAETAKQFTYQEDWTVDQGIAYLGARTSAFVGSVPNINSLVSNFDLCVSLALLDQPLPQPTVTFYGT